MHRVRHPGIALATILLFPATGLAQSQDEGLHLFFEAGARTAKAAETLTSLVRKMPNVRKLELNRFTGAPMGAAKYYLMAEIYFDNREDMMASLNSPEGQAAGKDIMSFAGKQIHMMFADVLEV